MGTREKLFRQKLADQVESLLTQSEKVFSSEKLTKEWLKAMLTETKELTSILTIYKFLHELPEDENLQIEFLELEEQESESKKEPEIPSYGDEIMKEIDEFDTQMAVDIEIADEAPTPPEQEKVVEEEPKLAHIPVPEEIVKEEEVLKTEDIPVQEKTEHSKSAPAEKPSEINDLIAKKDASLADKLSKKSISKLAESIALNERFLYSNELFNGNMEAFKRALTELDHIASLEDARRYIEVQLKEENDWKMDSEIVQGFISLVERRFN